MSEVAIYKSPGKLTPLHAVYYQMQTAENVEQKISTENVFLIGQNVITLSRYSVQKRQWAASILQAHNVSRFDQMENRLIVEAGQLLPEWAVN